MSLLELLKSIWIYIKYDKWKFYIFVFFNFLLSAYWMLHPYIFGKAVSSIVEGSFNDFLYYMLLLGGTYILVIFIAIIQKYFRTIVELNFLKRISKKIYQKALNLPVEAYDKKAIGEIVNKITTDPGKVIELLGKLIEAAVKILSLAAIFAIAINVSWVITIQLLLLSIFVYWTSSVYYPRFKKAQEELTKQSDKIISQANQTLTGVREVKGLGIKNIVKKLMFSNFDTIFDKKKKNNVNEIKYNAILDVIEIFFEVMIFITAGYFTITGAMSLELFIAFQIYVYRVSWFIRNLSELGTIYQKVVVSMVRINEIVENKLYKDEKFGNKEINIIEGDIKFKEIEFSYDENNKVLNKLSFDIEAGKKVAIVGKSGMGKSTLFNLMLNFYKPSSGKILIDDVDLNEFNEESLRKHISVIRQEPYLFNMTIKENFEIVKPNIKLKEIRELCKKTYIDEYIMSLSDKYDTLIGEGGINLSGGQKQRIAIARALAKETKIILFDESTSALDNESQAFIKDTINELNKNHTIIIIAHRLSTIMDADIIYLIDKGQVVAKGTHMELIHTSELYNSLYTPELIELNI